MTAGLGGLPIVKPPYGVITALDMNSGTLKWQVPHGDTPDAVRNSPLLKGMNIPKTGQTGIVGVVLTKSLVIVGDPQVTAAPGRPRGAMLRAYDQQTGKEVGAVWMPAAASTRSSTSRSRCPRASSGERRSGDHDDSRTDLCAVRCLLGGWDLLGRPHGGAIADIGAGTGAYTIPFAKAVAPSGQALAVDIWPELLDYIKEGRRRRRSRRQTVLAHRDDPRLPRNQVDIAFFHDVFHNVNDRQAYLELLGSSLKPGGRIAIIEQEFDDPITRRGRGCRSAGS